MLNEKKIEKKRQTLKASALQRAKTVEVKAGKIEAVGVIFKANGKVYKFNPENNKYAVGDVVVVNGYNKKPHTAAVVFGNTKVDASTIVQPFKSIGGEAIKVEIKEEVKAEVKAEAKPEVKAEVKPVEAKEEAKEEVKPAKPAKAKAVKAEKPAKAESSDEEDGDEKDKDETISEVAYDEEKGIYKVTKIKKTLEGKICYLEEDVKKAYSDIKNALLNIGLTSRMAKDKETFSYKRQKMAVIKLTKKTINIYLALDPANYAESKYKGTDVSDKKAYADVPFLYKAGTVRKNKWALELIEELGKTKELSIVVRENEDFASQYPLLDEEEMLVKGLLIKTTIEKSSCPRGYSKFVKII